MEVMLPHFSVIIPMEKDNRTCIYVHAYPSALTIEGFQLSPAIFFIINKAKYVILNHLIWLFMYDNIMSRPNISQFRCVTKIEIRMNNHLLCLPEMHYMWGGCRFVAAPEPHPRPLEIKPLHTLYINHYGSFCERKILNSEKGKSY